VNVDRFVGASGVGSEASIGGVDPLAVDGQPQADAVLDRTDRICIGPRAALTIARRTSVDVAIDPGIEDTHARVTVSGRAIVLDDGFYSLV